MRLEGVSSIVKSKANHVWKMSLAAQTYRFEAGNKQTSPEFIFELSLLDRAYTMQ